MIYPLSYANFLRYEYWTRRFPASELKFVFEPEESPKIMNRYEVVRKRYKLPLMSYMALEKWKLHFKNRQLAEFEYSDKEAFGAAHA